MSNTVKLLPVIMHTDLYSLGKVLHTVGAKLYQGGRSAPSIPKQGTRCQGICREEASHTGPHAPLLDQ